MALNRDSFGFTYDKRVGKYTAVRIRSSKLCYGLFVCFQFLVLIIHIFASLYTSGYWMMPWVMQSIDTRIVNRSNAISDWKYGRNLIYREFSQAPNVVAATMVSAVFPLVGALLYFSVTR